MLIRSIAHRADYRDDRNATDRSARDRARVEGAARNYVAGSGVLYPRYTIYIYLH